MKKTWIFVALVLFALGLSSCTEQPTSNATTEENIQTTETLTTTDTPTTIDNTTEEQTTIDSTTNTTTEEITTVEIVELRDSYFQYSTNSTQNILLLHLNITDDVKVYDTNDQLLNKDDVLVKNDYYEIKSSYILSLEEELVEFYLVFDNKKTLISINVSNKDIPYIISSTLVYTDASQDIMFQFELFDGFIEQVNANNMESSDYTISDNLLTIDKSFLSDTFIDNDQFIISYSLEGTQLVIGMITVNQE
jgi:hypothetical protein